MNKRCVMLLICLLLGSLGIPSGRVKAEETQQLRALLIGCDHFLSQADTSPAAENNIDLLARALLRDSRGYALVRTLPNAVSSYETMEQAIRETFGDAQPADLSLLYISTHGVYEEGTECAEAALLFSDGVREELISARALQDMLNAVPGKKLLILDACHSGAFIGKGLSGHAGTPLFNSPDYKVLCSAGGSEASWYWQGNDAVSGGASYFATVLADAMGVHGYFPADRNSDGRVTLAEAYAYILENYAASTPQVYPQREKETILFQYDADNAAADTAAITGITFDDTLLPAGQREVAFSFTVRKPSRIYYQLVYHENGAWQFGSAQYFLDAEEPDGAILPGRKARTLCLDTGRTDAFGYAMLQFITIEEGSPALQGSRLLCVPPAAGEISLSVEADAAFFPGSGQEAAIRVLHDKPCGITVSVLNAAKETVCHLSYDAPSRPQQLTPAASTFYWDGKDDQGHSCAPGLYTVSAKTRIGDTVQTAESAPITLLPRMPAPGSGIRKTAAP